jgi:RIO-like serine/threonine protein kinase
MKTYLISRTEARAEVFEVKAKDEDEAIIKLQSEGMDKFKKVNQFTTDVIYQYEGSKI